MSEDKLQPCSAELLELNRERYHLCISYLNMKIPQFSSYPSHAHLGDGAIMINDVLNKKFEDITERNLFLLNMKEFIDRECISPLSYAWIIQDQKACYFAWLLISILAQDKSKTLFGGGVLSEMLSKPCNSHDERMIIVMEYFSNFYADPNAREDISKYHVLANKKYILNVLLSNWNNYFQRPTFKWFLTDDSEVMKIVWNCLQCELPFLKTPEKIKRVSLKNLHRNPRKKEVKTNKTPNEFNGLDIDITITNLEEMSTAIYSAYGIWVSFCNPHDDQIKQLKKKIARAVSDKNPNKIPRIYKKIHPKVKYVK